LVLWVSKKKTTVYQTHEGDSLKEVFKLELGDVCVLGEKKVTKTFQYTEILCQKGYGWIVDGEYEFDLIKKPRSPI